MFVIRSYRSCCAIYYCKLVKDIMNCLGLGGCCHSCAPIRLLLPHGPSEDLVDVQASLGWDSLIAYIVPCPRGYCLYGVSCCPFRGVLDDSMNPCGAVLGNFVNAAEYLCMC